MSVNARNFLPCLVLVGGLLSSGCSSDEASEASVSRSAVVKNYSANLFVAYSDALDDAKEYLNGFGNLQLIGRNGTHKYNNQDHSMLTAILAVRNLFGEHHDIWGVNADDDYHEEIPDMEFDAHEHEGDLRRLSATQPYVPIRIDRQKN